MTQYREQVVGVLLAGGLSRRMGGGDKSLSTLQDKTILERVIDRLQPQCRTAILNANGDADRFARFGLPVVEDVVDGFAGPLAGVLTGMRWAQKNVPSTEWIATIATDTPFFPPELVEALCACAENTSVDIVHARSNDRVHPVFGLWRVALADDLEGAMTEEGVRKVLAWTDRHACAHVDFPASPFDPFFNVNTPEQLEEAEQLMKAHAL